jgi:hypothetical protein
MAEPSATLYDNHNDSSISSTLWQTQTQGNGVDSEDTAYLRMNAPGTGADVDRAAVYQKIAGGNGAKMTFKYSQGAGGFERCMMGIADFNTFGGSTWVPDFGGGGNYIAITIGLNSSTVEDKIRLNVNGYTATTDNSPINVSQGTDYTLKIYENGDGTILVYIDSTHLATITGDIITGSYMRAAAGAAGAADRNFNLYLNEDYDYVDNPEVTFIPKVSLLSFAGIGFVASQLSGLLLPQSQLLRA